MIDTVILEGITERMKGMIGEVEDCVKGGWPRETCLGCEDVVLGVKKLCDVWVVEFKRLPGGKNE